MDNSASSERKASGAGQFRKVLEVVFGEAERKYNHEVTVLLKAVDLAQETGDSIRLEMALNISVNWIAYFRSIKSLINQDCFPLDENTKATLSFINEQIRFLGVLANNIEDKLFEMRSKDLGFSFKPQ
ncbi:MAG: hypothetical protein NT055_00440 [Nitrospirae bacterium]|nr:hypothetical protein [Nitrospirota bacterium]